MDIITDAVTILIKLIGLGMILVFLFIIVSISLSEIGTKPWKEK